MKLIGIARLGKDVETAMTDYDKLLSDNLPPEDSSHAMSMETFELRFIAGLGAHSEMMIDKGVLLARYLKATMARNPLPAPAPAIIKAVRARAENLGLDGEAIIAQAMGGP